jgi:2-methylisocitrate lyase-like PEP mutase family enzyme
VAEALSGAVLMANLVEGGDTPLLPPKQLEALGFRIAAYPLTLLSAAVRALEEALTGMRNGAHPPDEARVSFEALREIVGFPDYEQEASRYEAKD